MVFTLEQVLDAIKRMELSDHSSNSSHCQQLTHSAQKLGFASYESLRNYLSNPPQDRISSVYASIMRKVCSIRLTDNSKKYLQMRCAGGSSITYSAMLAGRDFKGKLVRHPYLRPLNNEDITILRELYAPLIYVIETKAELLAWFRDWHGIAYVSSELTKKELSELYRTPKLKPIRPFKFGFWGPEPDLEAEAKYLELVKVLQEEAASCLLHESTNLTSKPTAGGEQTNELETLFQQLKGAII